MFAKNDSVIQVMPAPIKGTVSGFSVDQETGKVLVGVQWPDADGSTHSRYFEQAELEAEVIEVEAVSSVRTRAVGIVAE